MKCPNCGNEAINVNGKFVCLDCGIEISGTAEQASAGVATTPIFNNGPAPQTINHPQATAVVDPEPAQGQPTATVKDQFLEELKQEEAPAAPGVYDFKDDVKPATGAPDFPVGTDVAPGLDASAQINPNPVEVIQPEPASGLTNDLPASLNFDALSGLSPTPTALAEGDNQTVSEDASVNDPFDVQLPSSLNLGDPVPATPEPSTESNIREPVTPAPELPVEIPGPSTNSVAPAAPEPLEEGKIALEPVMAAPEMAVEAPEPPVAPGAPAEPPIETATTPEPEVPEMGVETSEEPAVAFPAENSVQESEVFNPKPEEEVEIPINVAPTTPAETPAAPVEPASDAQPETYFQPSSVDITPQQPSAGEAPVEQNPENPAQSVPPTTEAGNNLDLDTLLDKYSAPAASGYQAPAPGGSVDSVRPAQYSNYDLSQNQPAPTEENGIPSVASVFEDGYVDPKPAMEEKAKKNHKIKLLILIGFLAFLGLAGLVGFLVYGMNSQNQELSAIQQIEKTVMESVPAKIEAAQDLKVTYKEDVDFSKLSIKSGGDKVLSQNLLDFFSKTLLSDGNWETNLDNDLAQNSKQGDAVFKRTYIEEEKTTYSVEKGGIKKLSGRQIAGVPVFFNPVERGSLFYSAKTDRLVYQKKAPAAEINEFRVMPKEEFLKEALASTSPLFSKTKIQSIKSDNLVILVQVDEENVLHSVTVKGSMEVDSDYFSGPITFNSSANYTYGFSEIVIPE